MEIPRHWRLKAQRYRLEGSVCPNCGRISFPPRPACPHCTAQQVHNADDQLSILQPLNRKLETVASKG